MVMTRRTSLSWLVAAMLAAGTAPAVAASADDAAARVVVPLVAYGPTLSSRVFIENHESFPVALQVLYVGDRSGPHAGKRTCFAGSGGMLVVNPLSVANIDPASSCALTGVPDFGMLVVSVRSRNVMARISARARVDVRATAGYSVQTFMVDGVPVGSLDSTENLHLAAGLAQGPGPFNSSRSVDCSFATLDHGSNAGSVLGRLGVRDDRGVTLGTDQFFLLRPFDLARFKDVFKLVGAPAGSYEGARVEFGLAGGGDVVLGHCWTVQSNQGAVVRTYALSTAQVADPQEETRRRSIRVEATPGVTAPGWTFVLAPPATSEVVHGLYVRHPDIVKCSVLSNHGLRIEAVPPDGVSIGALGPVVEFATVPHAAVNGGQADLWGLEISWAPGAAALAAAPYAIDCRSGNGTSLADQLFRQ
jgi:hypothetical protein